MKKDIIEILKNFDLNNIDTLSKRVNEISPEEWLKLSDILDDFYSNNDIEDGLNSNSLPLDFRFPCFPPNILPKISSHLLFADKVFIDDPLYEYVWSLSMPANPQFVAEWGISQDAIAASEWVKKSTLSNVIELITFYLKAKELIKENKVIPYKQTSLPSKVRDYEKLFLTHIKKDKKLRKIIFGPRFSLFKSGYISSKLHLMRFLSRNKNEIKINNKDTEYLFNAQSSFENIQPLLTSLSTFAISGGLQGKSIDFMTPEYAYIFRKCLEIASKFNEKLDSNTKIDLPAAFSNNIIQVPLLCNIPVEYVLDSIERYPDAFISFRGKLNEKLMQIYSPVGSIERDQEISMVQDSIKKDIADLNIAYKGTQKLLTLKLSINISLGLVSILTGALSAAAYNLNALSIASGIFAGTTLSKSIKDILKDLLDHQKEITKFKSNENYFVWKLLSESKNMNA